MDDVPGVSKCLRQLLSCFAAQLISNSVLLFCDSAWPIRKTRILEQNPLLDASHMDSSIYFGAIIACGFLNDAKGVFINLKTFFMRKSTQLLFLFFVLLLAVAVPALAQTCSSVTFPRDTSLALGECLYSGNSCTTDANCGASANDYCMKAVCDNNPNSFCVSDANCGSGGKCVEDITFTFDKPYRCGQYVTGDWWVEASSNNQVTITSIDPPHSSACEAVTASSRSNCRNGWSIDPVAAKVGLSGRIGVTSVVMAKNATSIRNLSLPHTVSNITKYTSILKAIDGGKKKTECWNGSGCTGPTQHVALLHAAVLTVIPNGQTPAADAFRPAYHGPTKQQSHYTVSNDLQLGKMPKIALGDLADTSKLPPMAEVARYFDGPFVGIAQRNSSVTGMLTAYKACRGYPSCDSSSHYHAQRAGNTNRNLLRLVFDDTDYVNNSLHKKALYGAIQSGIDKAWSVKGWNSNRIKDITVPAMFAAFMLDDQSLTDFGGFDDMSEVDTFFDSPRYGLGHPGDYLWGYTVSESKYWQRSSSGKAADKWSGDPYGYAEGTLESVGGSYQWCCSMGPWRGGALFVHLMQMESVFDVTGWLHVSDRYFNGWDNGINFPGGRWASPDPCKANSGVRSSNPSNCHLTHSCECKSGSGRTTSVHGTTGGISWNEGFAGDVWSSFRSCAAATFRGSVAQNFPCAGMASSTMVSRPSVSPNGGVFAEGSSVEVTLNSLTDGSSIYYTTNGSTPTQSSTRYTSPFSVSGLTTVKARAFKSALDPSPITSVDFRFETPSNSLDSDGNENWINSPFISQSGSFQLEFDATPSANSVDALSVLSQGPASTFSDGIVRIRFALPGIIDVRGASSYTADQQVSYVGGQTYHFRVQVDVSTKVFTVFVTPQGGSEILLASNFSFPTSAPVVSSLTNFAVWSSIGSHSVENISFGSNGKTTPNSPANLRLN